MTLTSVFSFSTILIAIRFLFAFLTNKIIAIYFGPSGIAIIGQFNNFVGLIGGITFGGLNAGVVKYTSEFREKIIELEKIWQTAFSISIVLSIIIFFIVWIEAVDISIYLFNSKEFSNVIIAFTSTLVLFSISNLIMFIYNGMGQIKKLFYLQVLQIIVNFFIFYLMFNLYDFQGVLYSFSISNFVLFVLFVLFVNREEWFSAKMLLIKFDHIYKHKFIKYFYMSLTSLLTVHVAQIVIRQNAFEKCGLVDVGYLQGMWRMSDMYLMLFSVMINTYYIQRLSAIQEKSAIKNEIYKTYMYIFPTLFIVLFSIYIFRIELIRFIYTIAFDPMKDLFVAQLLGDFFKILSWILSSLLWAKALTKAYIITEIIQSFIYIFLGIFLLNYFGISGAIYAYTICFILYFVILLFYFKKRGYL